MQDIIAILIASVAAGYLVRRWLLRTASRRAAACGGCAGCATKGGAAEQSLVSITLDRGENVR